MQWNQTVMIVMGDDHRHHYDDHDNDDDKIGMKFYHARSNKLFVDDSIFFSHYTRCKIGFPFWGSNVRGFFVRHTVYYLITW